MEYIWISSPLEVYSSDEVKFIEAEHAKEHNGHCFDLMQQAGKAVFDFIVRRMCLKLKMCGSFAVRAIMVAMAILLQTCSEKLD